MQRLVSGSNKAYNSTMARHMRFDVIELIRHHFLIANLQFAFEKYLDELDRNDSQ